MRYLLTLGIIFILLFIFSAPTKAADVVETAKHSNSNTGINVIPIEPIAPKANKSNFWQKKFKFKPQQNQVEPISSGWYIAIGVYVIFSIFGFLLAGLYFFILAAFTFPAVALVVLSLILLGLIAAILYAIKLFSASAGKEGTLKGWRFALGYIVGILFTLSWVGVAIPFFGVAAAAAGIILPAAILIFNIVDHSRYKKYLKTLDNNPQ